jgi:flagellar biosynthesis protein
MSKDAPGSKKRNYAVALHYGKDDDAPRILAAGPGEIAKKILELAEDNSIPIEHDDSLVEILSKIDVGATIPMECYRAVAEIFAFLFRMDLAWKEKKLAEFPEFPASDIE